MKIVIDIPEEVYNRYMNYTENYVDFMFFGTEEKIIRAIRNGTPLPKGHGRLIDADAVSERFTTKTYWNGDVHRVILKSVFDDAPTIIKADKEAAEQE